MDVNTVIDMNWLESATLADFKAVLQMAKFHPNKLAEVNALLATEEGKAIASEMLNDPDYVPKSRQATPTPEEAAQIAADLAIANQQEAEAAAAAAAARILSVILGISGVSRRMGPTGRAVPASQVGSAAVESPSGRGRTPRKRVKGQPFRGFKSHLHRHFDVARHRGHPEPTSWFGVVVFPGVAGVGPGGRRVGW